MSGGEAAHGLHRHAEHLETRDGVSVESGSRVDGLTAHYRVGKGWFGRKEAFRAVNDVSGGHHDPDLLRACAEAPGVHLILGHMRGTPETMQDAPHYDDVLAEVASELEASLEAARAAGVAEERLAIDPGIGFGKRLEDNLALMAHAGWLRERLGRPVLVGPSRKSFLGRITGDPVDERETATLAACAVAAFAGADAVRVHTPDLARRAVLVGRAFRDARRKELT